MTEKPLIVSDVLRECREDVQSVANNLEPQHAAILALVCDKLYEIETGILEKRILPPPESIATGADVPSPRLRIRKGTWKP